MMVVVHETGMMLSSDSSKAYRGESRGLSIRDCLARPTGNVRSEALLTESRPLCYNTSPNTQNSEFLDKGAC